MTNALHQDAASKLNGGFLEEYNSEESIRKYTKETAGHGISYLLDHDYGKVYFDVLENCVLKSAGTRGVRLLEFGCGGGMNLLHLVSAMERRGIALDCAYGTDFSETLIQAANLEVKKYISPKQSEKVRFCVAKNENLIEDATKGLGISKDALLGSFDLIVGVNTIRYCHRLMNQDKCAREIFNLLKEGGVCIIIDMNNEFPAFRSRFRDRQVEDPLSTYLPSLDEYAGPFISPGFEILKKENFCWIPHSGGPALTTVMRALTPILNSLARSHAMRSLVISRKTGRARS